MLKKWIWPHLPRLLAIGWGLLLFQVGLFLLGVLSILFLPLAWQLDFSLLGWLHLTVGSFLLQRLLLAGHHSCAHHLVQEKRWPEALEHYQKSLRLSPQSASTYINMGNLFADQRQWEQAQEHYQIALRLSPDAPEAHNNLGTVWSETQHYALAIECYQRALQADPTYADAWSNLGVAWLKQLDWIQALECLERGYRLQRGIAWNEKELAQEKNWIENPPRPENITSVAKLSHDREQLAYLIQHGHLPAAQFQPAVDTYQAVINTYEGTHTGEQYQITLSPSEQKKVQAFYGRSLYVYPCPARSAAVLNQDLDRDTLQAQYQSASPQVIWCDNLLTPQCLHELYTFCLRSTIWHDFRKEGGYLGSYLDDGFNCGLLHQVAAELRQALPAILGDLPLIHMWGYKYDSRRSGIVTHADAAAVNVNFWVTPDESNADPNSGGMVVYDVAAPMDWQFQQYNINTPRIHSYIEHQNGTSVVIPYKCNRAVIFNSSLFHATDQFNFKVDYIHRRINITMLYGFRTE